MVLHGPSPIDDNTSIGLHCEVVPHARPQSSGAPKLLEIGFTQAWPRQSSILPLRERIFPKPYLSSPPPQEGRNHHHHKSNNQCDRHDQSSFLPGVLIVTLEEFQQSTLLHRCATDFGDSYKCPTSNVPQFEIALSMLETIFA